jgi:hypothetical protein
MIVIKIAITPSLKASSRVFVIGIREKLGGPERSATTYCSASD